MVPHLLSCQGIRADYYNLTLIPCIHGALDFCIAVGLKRRSVAKTTLA